MHWLGANELPLRPPAHLRRPTLWGPRQKEDELFFVQLQYCHKGLGGKLHTPQAPHLLFISPQKLFPFAGPPLIALARGIGSHTLFRPRGQVPILRPGPVSGLPNWPSPRLFRFSSIALFRPRAKCLFFVQLQYCHKGLGGKLYTSQAPHLLFISPQKFFLLWGPL